MQQEIIINIEHNLLIFSFNFISDRSTKKAQRRATGCIAIRGKLLYV